MPIHGLFLQRHILIIMLLQYKSSVIFLCVILYPGYLMSLDLVELRVPTHVPLGIRAVLLCRWQLGPTDVLYSLKWYKDGKEFFRHIPKDDEPLKKFVLPGVDVKEFDSFGSNLTLARAGLATTGRYRCEVSGERPQFQTVSKYADLLVVDLPAKGLYIHGHQSRYHVGDHINVSCSSNQSKPGVKLAWYINGALATSTVMLRSVYNKENGEITLEIEFTVMKSLVGNLTLQCVATLNSIYWRTIEKIAIVSETAQDAKEKHLLKNSIVVAQPKNGENGLEEVNPQLFRLLYFWVLYNSFQQ